MYKAGVIGIDLQHASFWGFWDFNIIVAVLFLIAAWKWGDWRNWKYYYPTILYFIIGDLLYLVFTCKYPLWQHESPLLRSTFSELILAFISFPATILLYLPYYPQSRAKRILHIFLWVSIYMVMEVVTHALGFISYHNGWNIWWSLAWNIMMFPMLRLHHKKPLTAWVISFIIIALFLVYFKVPLSSIK